jgi:septin family protein
MASSSVDSEAVQHAEKLRQKAGRFRILIIGRANAGKTTILQKVCNTTEGPKIDKSEGERVSLFTLYFACVYIQSVRLIRVLAHVLNI